MSFLVIKEEQAQDLANKFFDAIDVDSLRVEGKLSPKILIVKPDVHLFWQYHHRRSEIWQHIDFIPSDEDDIVRVKDNFRLI